MGDESETTEKKAEEIKAASSAEPPKIHSEHKHEAEKTKQEEEFLKKLDEKYPGSKSMIQKDAPLEGAPPPGMGGGMGGGSPMPNAEGEMAPGETEAQPAEKDNEKPEVPETRKHYRKHGK